MSVRFVECLRDWGVGCVGSEGSFVIKFFFVPCMLADNSGNLWFGTHGGGLTRFDAYNFTHFTQKEGLAGNSIFALIQAKDGCLWISTYGKGLSIFDGKNFRNFSTENGFPSDYIYSIFNNPASSVPIQIFWLRSSKIE